MNLECEACRTPFEAPTKRARYCSDRCKKRARRARGGAPAAGPQPVELRLVPPVLPAEPAAGDGPLTIATLRELDVVDRVDTVAGQAALMLARRLERPTSDSGSSIAALAREHRIMLQAALEGTVPPESPLLRLRMRDQARRAGLPLP